MEKIMLKASVRSDLGKSASKHLRKEGKVPGVIYKGGKAGINIQVDQNDLWHALHTEAGENAIITMDISDESKPAQKTVIVKEMQAHPLNEKFLHVDFYEVSLKEKLKVNVPVTVKGESIGVKEEDGILAQLLWELEVECLPTEIPEHIDVYVDEGWFLASRLQIKIIPYINILWIGCLLLHFAIIPLTIGRFLILKEAFSPGKKKIDEVNNKNGTTEKEIDIGDNNG